MAFSIIAIALLTITLSRKIYPDLLFARLLFSVGGAAASCMITAILPSVSGEPSTTNLDHDEREAAFDPDATNPNEIPSVTSTISATARGRHEPDELKQQSISGSPLHVSGIVGFASGIGALAALLLLLPLPAVFRSREISPAQAVRYTYYVASILSIITGTICFIGLRRLPGEENKSWRRLFITKDCSGTSNGIRRSDMAQAVRLGLVTPRLGLAYFGGLVARASSVCITTFVPLFINTCFIESGECQADGRDQRDIKDRCHSAYVFSSQLTGTSQTAALLFAIVFGVLAGKVRHASLALIVSAAIGFTGFSLIGFQKCPTNKGQRIPFGLFALMIMLGVSQIGAIVCSLGLLGQCVNDKSSKNEVKSQNVDDHENVPLMPKSRQESRKQLKGSIAGIYNLTGGLGILLLTKLGGYLFDTTSKGAPFFMMAAFNILLFTASALVLSLDIRLVKTVRLCEQSP